MCSYRYIAYPLSDEPLLHADRIIALYKAENWWTDITDDHAYLHRLIKGSHFFLTAFNQNEVIGMGRAISDGVSDAYLQDIAVKQSYRGQNIGSRIIQELIIRLHQDGLHWIGLIAERGTHPFYRKLGFNIMADAVPMLNQS